MFRSAINVVINQNVKLIPLRLYSKAESPSQSKTGTNINVNVAGLSQNCFNVPNTPVGPSASKDKEYKNPEYFCYHVDTFGEAEVELAKYRLPPPSNKRPFKQ